MHCEKYALECVPLYRFVGGKVGKQHRFVCDRLVCHASQDFTLFAKIGLKSLKNLQNNCDINRN